MKLKLVLLMSLGILTLSSSIGQTVTLSPSNTPKPEYRYNDNKVYFDYSIALDTGVNVVWDLLDIDDLITGVYYMHYTLENGKVLNKRFMVEN